MMVRQWTVRFVLVAVALLVVVDIVNAGPFANRRAARNDYSYNSFYSDPSVTPVTPVNQPTAQNSTKGSWILVDQGYYSGRGRRAQYVPNYQYVWVDTNVTPNQRSTRTTRTSFYSPYLNDQNVLVELRVPANAEVWFNGEKTNQTGFDRSYVSGTLTPNKMYQYEIKARWFENGQEVVKTQTVDIRPGESRFVNFLTARMPMP